MMTEQKINNTLYTNDNLLKLTEKEDKKFSDKVMGAWFWYMFAFKAWRGKMHRIKNDYNGFGIELPNMCVEIDDLFANFIEVEVKKTKNTKYKKFLARLFEEMIENKVIFGE